MEEYARILGVREKPDTGRLSTYNRCLKKSKNKFEKRPWKAHILISSKG